MRFMMINEPWSNMDNCNVFYGVDTRNELRGLARGGPEHLIVLRTAPWPRPGFFKALAAEYAAMVQAAESSVWLSPRFLPCIPDVSLAMQFAEANGISTDKTGFISGPPFSRPITADGHALSSFMTSRIALAEALEGDDSNYVGEGISAIDLGLRALMRGHRNLLSWTACLTQAEAVNDEKEFLGADEKEFLRVWGPEIVAKWRSGEIWKELRAR